jgi:hypothetical protein
MAIRTIIVCDYCEVPLNKYIYSLVSEGSRWDTCSGDCYGKLEDDSLREAGY